MSFTKSLAFAAAAATIVKHASAHGFVQGIVAGGQFYQGYNPNMQYQNPPPAVAGWSDPQDQDNGFVNDYSSPDIICHKGATPGQAYVEVAAGDTVELQWTVWPESHHGPMIDYLANCNGECTTVDKTSLKFNKIDEAGLVSPTPNPGKWASDEMIANNNSWVVTIPSSIASGNYVLRHETIALHSANNAGGAQNYPQCINLKISGSGSDSLSGGTVGTSLYTATDPGILVNIYQTLSSYIIPGPKLISGSGSGSQPSSGTGNGSSPTTTTARTTMQTVTRSSTVSLSAITSITTSIKAVTSTAAFTSTAAGGPAPSDIFTAPAGSSGTPKKFVCYEVDE